MSSFAYKRKDSYFRPHKTLPLIISYIRQSNPRSLQLRITTNNVVFLCNMLSTSFPAATFSGKTISSPPCHVKSRRVLISATATTTEPSCTSLYEILGVAAASSDQEIKAAYRRLARVSHPDVAAVDRKDSSADEFMKIHAAYSTLLDPEKRASYDRSLFRQRQPLTATRFSGYGCRKWETDQCW